MKKVFLMLLFICGILFEVTGFALVISFLLENNIGVATFSFILLNLVFGFPLTYYPGRKLFKEKSSVIASSVQETTEPIEEENDEKEPANQNLAECVVCKGNIWTDEPIYFDMNAEEYTNSNIPYHEVMNLPYKWNKSWLGEIKDIEFIKICDTCFCASGKKGEIIEQRLNWRDDLFWGHSNSTLSMSELLDKFLGNKVDFDNISGHYKDVLDLLRKIARRTNYYSEYANKVALIDTGEREAYMADYEEKMSRLIKLQKSIVELLDEKTTKMPASDIDAFLKHQDVDEIKELCEEMYHNGEISRTANYRYFVLTEEQKNPQNTSTNKSESADIPEQIKKLSELKDQGILSEDEFQSKKKELLDKM